MFSTGIASVCFLYRVVWSDLICHPRCFGRNQKPSKAHLFHTSEDSGYSCRKNPVVFVRCALCCRPDINQTPLLSPRHHVFSLPYFAIFFSFTNFFCVSCAQFVCVVLGMTHFLCVYELKLCLQVQDSISYHLDINL